MAVKTFTTETLTSADTNTYLANSGLVYVTSATIGSGVSSVTVSSAFSATYDNYKIIVAGGTSTNGAYLKFELGGSTTTYYGTYLYANYAIATPLSATINNQSSFIYAGGCNFNQVVMNLEIQSPFLAKNTYMQGLSTIVQNNYGNAHCDHELPNSYSSFRIFPDAGTISGGTITVYGYRKA